MEIAAALEVMRSGRDALGIAAEQCQKGHGRQGAAQRTGSAQQRHFPWGGGLAASANTLSYKSTLTPRRRIKEKKLHSVRQGAEV